jgi:hypothetical protein
VVRGPQAVCTTLTKTSYCDYFWVRCSFFPFSEIAAHQNCARQPFGHTPFKMARCLEPWMTSDLYALLNFDHGLSNSTGNAGCRCIVNP